MLVRADIYHNPSHLGQNIQMGTHEQANQLNSTAPDKGNDANYQANNITKRKEKNLCNYILSGFC